jgi:hypothetical protein
MQASGLVSVGLDKLRSATDLRPKSRPLSTIKCNEVLVFLQLVSLVGASRKGSKISESRIACRQANKGYALFCSLQ